MSRTIITAEIGYKDTSVSPNTTGTLYMASEGFVTASTDALANTYFAGRMGEVSYRAKISTGMWGGESSASIGSVDLDNPDGSLDSWLNYDFRDKAIVIKEHTSGASYDSATVLLNAIIEKMVIVGERKLSLIIRDPIAALVKPMTTTAYDNTTDADGVLKPIAFGTPALAKPVLVSEDGLQYDVADTAIKSIFAVYDQGVSVAHNNTTYGFQLSSAPSGKVTCTPIMSGTGNDPWLTPSIASPLEYTITNDGRTMEAPSDNNSGFADVNHSRVSSSGGKYYFEVIIDAIYMDTVNNDDIIQIAPGIQSSTLAADQSFLTSGLYVLGVGSAQIAGQNVWFEIDHDGSDLGEGYFGLADAAGDTIGVKVDFDALTIEYLYENSTWPGGTYAINVSPEPASIWGPWPIAAGTYFPVLGVDKIATRVAPKATIKLIESDLKYSLPAGYSAWSEGITSDTTFSKLVDSITSRLSGVTFDTTSVTAIDGLVHSSPETAYTYAYYLDDSYTASKLMTDAVSSFGGYWWVNRVGSVQVGQLTAPGTSVETITDLHITGDIMISPDNASGLSNGMGAVRNWSPYRESEVGAAATEVWKQQISREYQSEYRSSTTLADFYGHATGAPMPTSLLSDATAAQVEADRIDALYYLTGLLPPKFYLLSL